MATPADTATTHPGRDESPPHPWTLARVLAHHLLHAQQPRVHRVAPQRRDVRVAVMARQNRQQHGAQQITLTWRVRTAERQRAIPNPAVKQAGLLQILDASS